MRGRGMQDNDGVAMGAGLVVFFAVCFLGVWLDLFPFLFILGFPAMFATWWFLARYALAPPSSTHPPPTAYRPPRLPIPPAVKDEVWRRDGGRCVECGSNEKIHFDHIIPYSWGGSDTAENLQILCQGCNLRKGNRHL